MIHQVSMPTNKKRIQAFLEDDLYELLSEYAETHSLSMSQAVVSLLESRLLDKKKENSPESSDFVSKQEFFSILHPLLYHLQSSLYDWTEELGKKIARSENESVNFYPFTFDYSDLLRELQTKDFGKGLIKQDTNNEGTGINLFSRDIGSLDCNHGANARKGTNSEPLSINNSAANEFLSNQEMSEPPDELLSESSVSTEGESPSELLDELPGGSSVSTEGESPGESLGESPNESPVSLEGESLSESLGELPSESSVSTEGESPGESLGELPSESSVSTEGESPGESLGESPGKVFFETKAIKDKRSKDPWFICCLKNDKLDFFWSGKEWTQDISSAKVYPSEKGSRIAMRRIAKRFPDFDLKTNSLSNLNRILGK